MRLREYKMQEGGFTYSQRIEMADIFTDASLSAWDKVFKAHRLLYGWSGRRLPRRWMTARLTRMVDGIEYWCDAEKVALEYRPKAEEKGAGIEAYSKAVGDMGTIKAVAKAYSRDPDEVLKWPWAKVFGILQTDLEEFKYSERLREAYERRRKK